MVISIYIENWGTVQGRKENQFLNEHNECFTSENFEFIIPNGVRDDKFKIFTSEARIVFIEKLIYFMSQCTVTQFSM